MRFRVIMRSRVHMDEKDTNNKAEYQKKQDDIIVSPCLISLYRGAFRP